MLGGLMDILEYIRDGILKINNGDEDKDGVKVVLYKTYMMVLQYASDGYLREYLKINFNNINWLQKLDSLQNLSFRLVNIHKLDIIHQDFHPGNTLSSNFKNSSLGNPEKKNIVGVLPYIAPEVLSGDEEYTKAADVYSYGIIAYEMVTGFPPYPDIPHDNDLALKICNGLRPKIPFHTLKLITRIIMRPTFEELEDELYKHYDAYSNEDSEIRIRIENSEKLSKNLGLASSKTTTPLKNTSTSDFLTFQNFQNPGTIKIRKGT
ncbi:hypothetical protein Glove_19g280 [Diversispora epigaea]|uniref:Protein kinase domain-containing protein n=1 Tax=Diversispora epigaea TaxID=1348612 RepID=A0A397JX14_9GLOM|nr:hypothetical protein Glove_19g280 [Diversispora epigaea]